ncbi:MAG: hypothetical protein ACK2UW_04540 [Anaerolineales bacterium]|jgi:hypothetical protein
MFLLTPDLDFYTIAVCQLFESSADRQSIWKFGEAYGTGTTLPSSITHLG